MPRSSRSSARPAARPSAPSGPSGQTRQSSTAAYPQQPHQQTAYPTTAQHPAQTQGRQPGLLAQAASTMGGAVAGSVVGHGISNMLFGGSRHADSAQAADAPPPPAEYARQAQQATGNCDIPAKDFTKCLEATNGDMNTCSYYLEALKACQAAAKPY
ncbi:hypothetical protein JCM24511_03628 [Saitozyma sp. JCM 24511]|nr:hypothetical protein JCM24511_03628 [Saitozyma sp. JCM 24511]